jgi:catechol 1,2-dioxygenase
MDRFSRRELLGRGCLGLAGAGGLILAGDALATEASGSLGAYASYLQQDPVPAAQPAQPPAAGPRPAAWVATEPNILGPYYRRGAPYRAKITPPLEPGTVLVISGRVWGLDTRRPLANVLLDIWQANARGRYDNDDPRNPPAADIFKNRARLVTDESGAYEFETVHPGPYQIGENAWRPSHIHYLVTHPGYRQLVTQLYFRGDRHNRTDAFIRESLIIDLREQRGPNNTTYKTGRFDIVLAAAR